MDDLPVVRSRAAARPYQLFIPHKTKGTAGSRWRGFLFQPNNLAEHFIDDAAALDEDYAKERPGFAGDMLDNQAAVFHPNLIETFQFFVQRFGENFTSLKWRGGLLEAAGAWLAAGAG